MSIRKLKRSIARHYAEEEGYKPNRKYHRGLIQKSESKSAVKIFYENLFVLGNKKKKRTKHHSRKALLSSK